MYKDKGVGGIAGWMWGWGVLGGVVMCGGCRVGMRAVGRVNSSWVSMMGEVTHPRPHVGPKPRFPDGTLGLQNSLLLLVMQMRETLECLPWA